MEATVERWLLDHRRLEGSITDSILATMINQVV
jgi:hypothetical protein